MWLGRDRNDNDMLKCIFVADGNEDDLEEFNGLPLWENASLTPESKWKWKPLLDTFGFTLKQIKTQLLYEGEHPRFGLIIQKIGKFVPASDDSWCRIVTKMGSDQEGNPRAEIRKLMDYEDEEPEDEESIDEEENEDVDEEGDEEVEEEEVETEPAPSRRGGRTAGRTRTSTAAKPAAAKPSSTARKAPAAASTRSAPGRAAPSRSAPAKAPAAAPARRGRRAAAASTDEPPF